MIRLVIILIACTLWAPAAAPQSTPAQAADTTAGKPNTIPESATEPAGPAEYRIGAGDVLQVNVWKEPEASVQSVVVRPDGIVTLPLIKETPVLGLTPVELQQVLTKKLEQYIHAADVTVVVREIHSRKVYLVGAVNRVGPIPLLSNMTVLQALAEAGGLTDYAKRKKIYIIRLENGKHLKVPFDYDAVIKGEHMEQNVSLRPDDTIVVPH